jgi:glycosyltransferase involved in cell wall biosynthesis
MMDSSIDILMITYNRPEYTRLSLARLLETCDEDVRVWLWHNGDHQETLDIVRSYKDHGNVRQFHHSPENKKLNEPTNWLWSQSKGGLLAKVDDDCLLPDGWPSAFRQAHNDVPEFGVISCWLFMEEDFVPNVATKKIQEYAGPHKVLRNCWVGGSGYVMKRECVEQLGLLKAGQSFTNYCIRLASKGWVVGWYYPFLYMEHMDDPRSAHTLLKTDADLLDHYPLTAKNFGCSSLEEWIEFQRTDARRCQSASLDTRRYIGWRSKMARWVKRRL